MRIREAQKHTDPTDPDPDPDPQHCWEVPVIFAWVHLNVKYTLSLHIQYVRAGERLFRLYLCTYFCPYPNVYSNYLY
jgi:hypothetical protein